MKISPQTKPAASPSQSTPTNATVSSEVTTTVNTTWAPKNKTNEVSQSAANEVHQKVSAMKSALACGDSKTVLELFRGATAESNAALTNAYRLHVGRDLEYDMRGYSPMVKGLSGAPLKEGFAALHQPRIEKNVARIIELAQSTPSPQARAEVYRMVALAGGEERALLSATLKQKTGKNLGETLRPIAQASVNDKRAIKSDPKKTIAIVVSSGNLNDVVGGKTDSQVGGYHWREVEGYVSEAIAKGFTPVIFTVDGLPPSPDATGLLQGQLGPKVGLGLRAGTGPDSKQGQAIMREFEHPHALKDFDASNFATIHIAGGHGAHHDLVGNPLVEKAATDIHNQRKIVTAVCHATPALGKLLQGGPATGYSPQLDAMNVKLGFVLPEFDPPYDAHEGLRKLGAKVSFKETVESFVNVNHTEIYHRDNAPILTGTGPEATDDVARGALKWILEHQ